MKLKDITTTDLKIVIEGLEQTKYIREKIYRPLSLDITKYIELRLNVNLYNKLDEQTSRILFEITDLCIREMI